MTYSEMITAFADVGLRDKVKVAIIIAADKIRVEDPRATPRAEARQAWAKQAFLEPDSIVPAVLWAVLAQNRAAALSAVTGASDAATQTAVDAAVGAFAL